MPAYFKPLRRKIGVATLVAACLFTAGWVRSKRSVDILELGTKHAGTTKVSLVSSPDELSWMREEKLGAKPTVRQTQWNSIPVKDHSSHGITALLSAQYLTLWQWHLSGVNYCIFGTEAGASASGIRITIASLPYWSIVIPLTLLSAWLLLSKPRVAKSTETSQ